MLTLGELLLFLGGIVFFLIPSYILLRYFAMRVVQSKVQVIELAACFVAFIGMVLVVFFLFRITPSIMIWAELLGRNFGVFISLIYPATILDYIIKAEGFLLLVPVYILGAGAISFFVVWESSREFRQEALKTKGNQSTL